jgi:PAS domain S-box-containing protein
MLERDTVRAAEAELAPDAQTILEAIIANGQSRVFLVNVGPGNLFTYIPLKDRSLGGSYGRGIGAARSQTPADRFGPGDGARVAARYGECAAVGGPLVYEEVFHTPAGDRWWQTSLTPIKDAAGRVIQILGIAIDITKRKLIETRLSAAERQFQTIVANVPGVVYRRILHPDGRISYPYISEGVERLLGIDAAAVQADPSLMLRTIHPDDKVGFDRAIRRSAKNLSSFELEVRNILADGAERWVRSIAQTSRLDDGSIVWNGLILDITDRKQAEEEAAAASSRLLSAIESLSEGVAIFDSDDRLVLCNAKYRAIGGAASSLPVPGIRFEDLMRKCIDAGLFPAAAGREEEWLRQRMADHFRAAGSFERPTDRGGWLQVLEQRTPDGGIMILSTDITEVKQREMALTTLAAAEHNGRNFFEDVVRALAVGLGYRFAGIVQLMDGGKRITSLAFCERGVPIPGGTVDLAGTPWEQVLERGGFFAIDRDVAVAYPTDSGLAKFGAVSYVGDIVTDASGNPIGVVFGFDDKPDPKCLKRRDITGLIAARVSLELQRREAEHQLSQAKETAEVASRAKSEFLANMSHELRTPLNAVIGFAQMIGEEILGPVGRREYKEYARDIHSSSLHLLQIINDILDVSKIEAGMQTLHAGDVEFVSVVQSCRRLVGAKAAAAGITLNVEMPSDLPLLWADERMLKQVTLNLLSNALKFTPKGGTITLRAHLDDLGGLVFIVSDTGIGIAAKDFDKIFRPFGQVDSSMTRRFEGTGLGLPLTKGLVELHGGTVVLESEVGRGTTVTIHLPNRRKSA